MMYDVLNLVYSLYGNTSSDIATVNLTLREHNSNVCLILDSLLIKVKVLIHTENLIGWVVCVTQLTRGKLPVKAAGLMYWWIIYGNTYVVVTLQHKKI